MTGDLRPRLATLRVPTLIVHGTDDPLVLPACGQDTASSIAGAELMLVEGMLVEGMGHNLPPALYGTLAEAIDRMARRASIA